MSFNASKVTTESGQYSNQKEDYGVLIKMMLKMKKSYENNPYITVKGFDINIGISPSVTISIEFKK